MYFVQPGGVLIYKVLAMIFTHRVGLLFLLALVCAGGFLRAQTVDYVYGIEYGTGDGANNETWYLDQLAVNVNASGTATGYTLTHLVDLRYYVPGASGTATGWDFPGGGTTRYNQCINGLALDPRTNTFFYTYSYNNVNTGATNGTFYANTYAFRIGYSSTATLINSYSATTRTPGTAGSPGDPGSSSVGAGWFTKGTFYNGYYYAGIQTNTSNNIVRFTLAANQNSVTGTTVYTQIHHGGDDASQGGDMVFDSNGNLYISGRYSDGSGSTFATETLANAINTSGSSWNDATIGSDALYYQMAGMGQIPRLYGYQANSAGGSLTGTFGQFSNFTNPDATTPTFTTIGGAITKYADMSDGANKSQITPEPSTWAAGAIASAMAVTALFRIKFRKKDTGF